MANTELSSAQFGARRRYESVLLVLRPLRPLRASGASWPTMNGLTQQRLDDIASLRNSRPRACLGYVPPAEVHSKENSLGTLPCVAVVG